MTVSTKESRAIPALTSLKGVGAQYRFCLPKVVERPCGTSTLYCGWTTRAPTRVLWKPVTFSGSSHHIVVAQISTNAKC